MRRWVPILLLATGCGSADLKLVSKATAADTYYQDHYLAVCVEKVGPTTCQPCQTAINQAARDIPLANKVQKIGPMPKHEVSELNELITALEACP
jgi:hypothetical protein